MTTIPATNVTGLREAVPTATPDSAGIVPIATAAEVAIGTERAKAVTPRALAESRFFVAADRNGVQRTIPKNTWTLVACANETADPSKSWDANTGYFTAPATDLYRFSAKIRLADAAQADQIGLTVDTTGRDGAYTSWGDRAATGNRYTLECNRTMALHAGDQVAMWAYSPTSDRVLSNASITIHRV